MTQGSVNGLEPAVRVRDLVVRRGGRLVLDGLSLSVPRRSVVGLLGPSGSGKTTLMRCIVGVQKLRSGEVTVLGEPAGSPSLRRRVSYMTQTPSIYADLTVGENLRYFGTLLGIQAREAEAAAGDVGLGSAVDQLVATLSGGQRARASLACALLGGPELLVLDEPTVGQDPVLRDELWKRFRAMAESGATLLVSSHVMDEAERCDRVLLLHEGALLVDDTPDGIRQATGSEDMDEAFLRIVLAERAPVKG